MRTETTYGRILYKWQSKMKGGVDHEKALPLRKINVILRSTNALGREEEEDEEEEEEEYDDKEI